MPTLSQRIPQNHTAGEGKEPVEMDQSCVFYDCRGQHDGKASGTRADELSTCVILFEAMKANSATD
jgi:hypothetical protein